MAPRRAAAAARDPSSASASASAAPPSVEVESGSRRQEEASRWLQTLSEPELDFLISIKELAVTQATAAGHPSLAHRLFHLPTLRALGMVLLQDFKQRRKQSSGDANADMAFQRLALLRESEDDQLPGVQDNQDVHPETVPNANAAARRKRKQVQSGLDEDGGGTRSIKGKVEAESP